MEVITHRKGSTYEVHCQYTDSTGVPVSLVDVDIKSQIRTSSGNLIANCEVTVVSALAGEFSLRVLDTSNWPITALLQDIQYTLFDNRKINTSPITIDVTASVTQ
jgi:hypothetical protein